VSPKCCVGIVIEQLTNNELCVMMYRCGTKDVLS
jgi:hypothetical protein